jgi:hypothetical protein
MEACRDEAVMAVSAEKLEFSLCPLTLSAQYSVNKNRDLSSPGRLQKVSGRPYSCTDTRT